LATFCVAAGDGAAAEAFGATVVVGTGFLSGMYAALNISNRISGLDHDKSLKEVSVMTYTAESMPAEYTQSFTFAKNSRPPNTSPGSSDAAICTPPVVPAMYTSTLPTSRMYIARDDASVPPGHGMRCPALNFIHGPFSANQLISII